MTKCIDNRRLGLKGCGLEWAALAQAHCTVCHGQFASTGVAERHWTKDGHTDPGSVRRKNGDPLLELRNGVWHSYGSRPSDVWSSEPLES
jgi:hypothetical protein